MIYDDVYVVHDEGNGETSVWSNKPYAMAEVQAVKHERYNDDTSVIGKQLFFVADGAYRHDGEKPDARSMVYGTDYMKHEVFESADARMAEVRASQEKARRRHNGRG